MDIRVRKGKMNDIETLVLFLRNLFALETDFLNDTDNYRTGLALLLAEPATGGIFVAEADGIVAGMVTAQIVVSTSVGGYSVLLEDMYVDTGFRRQGIGTKLLEQVLLWGGERGARRLQLVAAGDNTGAMLFYQQAGLSKSKMTALYGQPTRLGTDSV